MRAEREAERTFEASQNDVGEKGHDGGADKARNGHRDKPGHEDVSEQPPVHSFPGAQPPHSHHRPDLAVSSGNWKTDVGSHHNSDSGGELDAETA